MWFCYLVLVAGRSAKENLLFTEVTEGLNSYGVTRHRHGKSNFLLIGFIYFESYNSSLTNAQNIFYLPVILLCVMTKCLGISFIVRAMQSYNNHSRQSR